MDFELPQDVDEHECDFDHVVAMELVLKPFEQRSNELATLDRQGLVQ